MAARLGIGMVISGVMIAIGIFIAGRLLMRPDEPLTGTLLVDAAFALFFMARGSLHIWSIRRRERALRDQSFRDPE